MSGHLIRFGLTGVVNTAVYYGLYLLFLLPLPYQAAHVLAFALSVVGSFFMHSWFTYRTRPTWRKFFAFPLTTAANFLITTGGIHLLVNVLHTDRRTAPLLAAACAIPITFALTRAIMLPRPPPPPGPPVAVCCGGQMAVAPPSTARVEPVT
ncbi:GtrA family protein [Streptomyces sp. NPDC126933]|uniref:GtrA family protein n=1 Tax=unclassified Streptomyces TaxID=2593676 RepID=UPI0036555DFC